MLGMTERKGFIIAIDGPMASGKGTLAPLLAEKLGGFYIDTGVFFRCLALYCLEHGINVEDKNAVITALPKISIHFLGEKRVLLNKDDVSDKIRTVEVSAASSKIATINEVQYEMISIYRSVSNERLARGAIIVIEGRNTATAIFPSADVKLYLTARLSVRAERRLQQWLAMGMTNISLAEVAEEIKQRDSRDEERKIYPLPVNPERQGYIMIDNSDYSKEKTVKVILDEIRKRGLL